MSTLRPLLVMLAAVLAVTVVTGCSTYGQSSGSSHFQQFHDGNNK
ncbi:hypothetical protein [Crenobacter intestini]|nr:hypothetical protein [Crenobacter intestini]